MEEPISFWGYKEQESNLILPEHDDDDDDDDDDVCMDESHNWVYDSISMYVPVFYLWEHLFTWWRNQ